MALVSINDTLRAARELYDVDPGPSMMQVVLDAMYETLSDIAKIRGELGDLTEVPVWEGLLHRFAGDREALARDRAALMTDWDERANQFWLRFEQYEKITNQMAAGEITGEYSANVVQPVLYGKAYASPGREVWSHAEFADVIEPFRLWNELNEYLVGTDYVERIAQKTQAVVQEFGRSAGKAAGEYLIGPAVAAAKEAAEPYIKEYKDLLTEEGKKATEQISGAIWAGIAVAAGLGIAAAFVFSRKRRR